VKNLPFPPRRWLFCRFIQTLRHVNGVLEETIHQTMQSGDHASMHHRLETMKNAVPLVGTKVEKIKKRRNGPKTGMRHL